MGLTLVTAPAVEPVSLQEAKDHLRVDHASDDALIEALIAAARRQAENITGLRLVAQTWRWTLDGFVDVLRPPIGPVSAVNSIKYLDTAGVEQTLAAAKYRADLAETPERITPAYGESWPSTYDVTAAVKVELQIGFGGFPAAVPDDIRLAMLLIVGRYYAHREDVITGTIVAELPGAASSILVQHRRWGF